MGIVHSRYHSAQHTGLDQTTPSQTSGTIVIPPVLFEILVDSFLRCRVMFRQLVVIHEPRFGVVAVVSIQRLDLIDLTLVVSSSQKMWTTTTSTDLG
jgi:hypothetical protein